MKVQQLAQAQDQERTRRKLEKELKLEQLQQMNKAREAFCKEREANRQLVKDVWREQERLEGIVTLGEVVHPIARHDATVILLNEFGGAGKHWSAFQWALGQTETACKSLRWVALDAPLRPLRPQNRTSQHEEMPKDMLHSWFDYHDSPTNDNIDVTQVRTMRSGLHKIIQQEVDILLERSQDASNRIVLVGFSQGGSMAIDAALTLQNPNAVKAINGVVMLRSAPLHITIEDCPANHEKPLHVLNVCGNFDHFYRPHLVHKMHDALPSHAVVTDVRVIDGPDHGTWYHCEEIELMVCFVVKVLQHEDTKNHPFDAKSFRKRLEPWACLWDQLTDEQHRQASRLGIQNHVDWNHRKAAIWRLPWNSLTCTQRSLLGGLGIESRSMWEAITSLGCDSIWRQPERVRTSCNETLATEES